MEEAKVEELVGGGAFHRGVKASSSSSSSRRSVRRAKPIIQLLFNTVALWVATVTLFCLGNNSPYTSIRWVEAINESQQCGASASDGNNKNRVELVPKELLQSFGAYPNILNITSQMRSEFHPVMKFPLRTTSSSASKDLNHRRFYCYWPWHEKKCKIKRQSDDDEMMIYQSCVLSGRNMDETYDYIVKDFTQNNNNNDNKAVVVLEGGEKVPHLLSSREEAMRYSSIPKQSKQLFDVGRYDEDRRGMYTSTLFGVKGGDSSSSSAGERRTVHVGIDIGAPVGTAVYAFEDGRVHSAGYNPDVGDYGNVVVIEHILKSRRRVYALYGHLSAESIKGKYSGKLIKRGQVIGSVGNTAENGGWTGMSS